MYFYLIVTLYIEHVSILYYIYKYNVCIWLPIMVLTVIGFGVHNRWSNCPHKMSTMFLTL